MEPVLNILMMKLKYKRIHSTLKNIYLNSCGFNSPLFAKVISSRVISEHFFRFTNSRSLNVRVLHFFLLDFGVTNQI